MPRKETFCGISKKLAAGKSRPYAVGHYAYVRDDIRTVIDAGNGVPVKVIHECHHLSQDEIKRACELCVEAGAAFVKTGTGWAPHGSHDEENSLNEINSR